MCTDGAARKSMLLYYTQVLYLNGFLLWVKPETRRYRLVETRVIAQIPRVHDPFATFRTKLIEVVHDNSRADHDEGKIGDRA
jgi:hypothetical protein